MTAVALRLESALRAGLLQLAGMAISYFPVAEFAVMKWRDESLNLVDHLPGDLSQ